MAKKTTKTTEEVTERIETAADEVIDETIALDDNIKATLQEEPVAQVLKDMETLNTSIADVDNQEKIVEVLNEKMATADKAVEVLEQKIKEAETASKKVSNEIPYNLYRNKYYWNGSNDGWNN